MYKLIFLFFLGNLYAIEFSTNISKRFKNNVESLIKDHRLEHYQSKTFFLLDNPKLTNYKKYHLAIHNESFQIGKDYFHKTVVKVDNLSLQNYQDLQEFKIEDFHEYSCFPAKILNQRQTYSCQIEYIIYFKDQPLRHFDPNDNLHKLSRNQVRFITQITHIPHDELSDLLNNLNAYGPITVDQYQIAHPVGKLTAERWSMRINRQGGFLNMIKHHLGPKWKNFQQYSLSSKSMSEHHFMDVVNQVKRSDDFVIGEDNEITPHLYSLEFFLDQSAQNTNESIN